MNSTKANQREQTSSQGLTSAPTKRAEIIVDLTSAFNGGSVSICRTTVGALHWQRHPDQDTLLHMLEGKTTVTVRSDNGLENYILEMNEMLIIPRGRWYRQDLERCSVQMWITPGETEQSAEGH